jgi:2-phospho-L-lactate guanylyltransferase
LVWAAVPFKGLAAPKRRLASALSLLERRRLAAAMLRDVLSALRAASGFGRLLVIGDLAALQLADRLGAEPLLERGRTGYRSAAEQAASAARAGGAAGLLVLPADLPLATSADLECLLLQSRKAAVTLVSSRDGRGTNALLTRPPGVIPYQYGCESFRAHVQAAERRSLQVAVLNLPALALDIDQPGDLQFFLDHPGPATGTATWRYLEEIGASARLTLPEMPGPRPHHAR